MDITPEGIMYVLEYGAVYGADNDDARLVRIDYNAGNRAPVAKISVKDSIGIAPLKVDFSSSNSYDYDEDDLLKYEWTFEGNKAGSTEANPTYTFSNKGVYKVTLKVTDPSGLSSVDTLEIKAGNTMPEVAINTTGNSSFYFGDATLGYAVEVKDKEDATIDPGRIHVKLDYIPKEQGSFKTVQGKGTWVMPGKALIASADCKACHTVDHNVVGPAFTAIAAKYSNKPGEIARLAGKIITGGAGVWGNDHYMNAHPQLSKDNATIIVKYILSLAQQKTQDSLAATGTALLKQPVGATGGTWALTAAYTDGGNSVVPLTTSKQLVLRQPTIQAEDADVINRIQRDDKMLGSIHNKSYFVLKGIDLKGIKNIVYYYSSEKIGAALEVHIDSIKGAVVSTLNYQQTGSWNKFKQVSASVSDPGGIHDLYFVFKKDTEPNHDIFALDWLRFEQ
jgi:cytochrome c